MAIDAILVAPHERPIGLLVALLRERDQLGFRAGGIGHAGLCLHDG